MADETDPPDPPDGHEVSAGAFGGDGHSEMATVHDSIPTVVPAVPKLRRRDEGARTTTVQVSRFESPFPPPDVLARYEEVRPGSGNEIFALVDRQIRLVEQQQQHDHAEERKFTSWWMRSQDRGGVFGFVLALAALVASTIMILHGASAAGVGLMLSSIGAIAYAHHVKAKENRQLGPGGEDVESEKGADAESGE